MFLGLVMGVTGLEDSEKEDQREGRAGQGFYRGVGGLLYASETIAGDSQCRQQLCLGHMDGVLRNFKGKAVIKRAPGGPRNSSGKRGQRTPAGGEVRPDSYSYSRLDKPPPQTLNNPSLIGGRRNLPASNHHEPSPRRALAATRPPRRTSRGCCAYSAAPAPRPPSGSPGGGGPEGGGGDCHTVRREKWVLGIPLFAHAPLL